MEKGKYAILKGGSIETVKIEDIDRSDRAWAVSWPAERLDEKLTDSVGRLGVMRPLWVLGGGAGMVVVDGFRRLAAASEAELNSLPVIKIQDNTDHREIFLARSFDLAGRLTVVESSRLVKKLRDEFGCGEEDLIQNFLPLWGLGGSRGVLKKMRELERLQEPVARWCAENGAGLRDAALWAAFPREGQRAMLVLVRTFKPGGNLLRSYLELAGEISVRENAIIENILSDPRIRKLLLNPQAAASGGRETVHRILLERRYPELTSLEQRLKELSAALELTGTVRLEPPRLFEGNRYSVSFDFGSPEELESTALKLLNAARSGRAGGLFRLLGAPDKGGERQQ